MKRFYVTFGMGTIFRGYHAVFEATSENIVRRFMNCRYGRVWSNIYTTEPKGSKPLQDNPEALFYAREQDVA